MFNGIKNVQLRTAATKHIASKNTFAQAVQAPKRVLTDNGAATFSTTSNSLLDLFAIMGSARGKDLTVLFSTAMGEDPYSAMRMLFWLRDVRGGAGERESFRKIVLHLESFYPHILEKVMWCFSFFGRYDDLLIFKTDKFKNYAYYVIAEALSNGDGLCAKWMPRKGPIANELRKYLELTPKEYRKLLVSLSSTVESKMCAKEWGSINYNHVPSVAAARYQKAFGKHDADRYKAYRDALLSKDPKVKASVKINAAAIFPHDVLKSIFAGDAGVAEAQWNALPNYLGDNDMLPMVDVSASMGSFGGAGKGVVRPIDIALSLGLYCADKQKGAFKDLLLTFSGAAKIYSIKGTIRDKVNQIHAADRSMANTNVEKAFQLVLKTAVTSKVPQSEMPKVLLIVSDMEFDQCSGGWNQTAFERATQEYSKYGYALPKIVFWNVNGREGNNPVTSHQTGAALISGYSPAILKSVLSGNLDKFTPTSVMMETIMNERYDVISECLNTK